MNFTENKSQDIKNCGILSLSVPPRLKKHSSPILIIEDDLEILSLLKEFFETEGYLVVGYNDSKKASEDLVYSPNTFLKDIQVIISDYSMPGMNGLEVLHSTKFLNRNIKTILISAYNSRVTEILALQQGAYAFFPKPLSLLDLQKKVDQALMVS